MSAAAPISEDDLKAKHCPYYNKPCLRENCLAFYVQKDVVWDETELAPVGDFVYGETRDADVTTGRKLQADLGTCVKGVFVRALINLRELDSDTPAGEMRTERNVVVPDQKNGEPT